MKDKKLADFLSFNTAIGLRNLAVGIKEKTMATRTNNNRTYYINPAYLTFNENSGYGANLIQVSASSSCWISVYDKANGIGYSDADKNYQRWKVTAYNNKFPDNDYDAYRIYVRLERNGTSALIVYSKRVYNVDGSSADTEASADYYYIYIGDVSATDGISIRSITYDTGYLESDQGYEDANDINEMWEWDKTSYFDWLIKAKKWLHSFTVKGFIELVGGLIFKKGEIEKNITDIKRSTDNDDEVPVSDSTLPTTKYVREMNDDRYLRKDKDDKTPFNLGVGQNLTVGQDVIADKDVIVGESTHSKDFVSGFVDGKGWAIRLKEWVNAAGSKETKSVAEFDELVVRDLLRVSEFIISQLLGENDNRIFTGMMEVDHYDASDGKIYLKTNGGKLYNTFRVDDVLTVQQYSGNTSEGNGHYITKQYELIVTEVGLGEQGEDRLDWIRFRNFTTSMEGGNESLITERDTLVRIDNLSDANRKGVIQLMSVGEDTPYMDFIYGAKTDPENSLKGRLGNLGGVYNPLFGWLKEFGAYLTNLYAVGEFVIAHTGEDVSDAIEISKGQFRTNFRQSIYDMSEEQNFFTNAAMTNNCEHWTLGSDVTEYFLVDGLPQFFNYDLYATEQTYAGLAAWKGRDMLRLCLSTIRQANELIRKPGKHTKYGQADEDGNISGVEEDDKLYLSVRFFVADSGNVELGFVGTDGSFIDNEFHYSKELMAREDGYEVKLSGVWDGVGDFCVTTTGDVYIDLLSLTDDPLENFKITTSTAIEQTAQSIKLMGTKITNETTTNLKLVVDALNSEIRAQASRIDNVNNTINNSGWITSSTAVTIFSQQVSEQGIAKTADIKTYVDNSISNIHLSADKITIDGVASVNKTFKIGTDGYMTCIGGTIGGFTIKEKRLTATSGVNMVLNAGEESSYPSIGWFGSASAAYASLGVVNTDGYIAGQLTMSKVGGGAMVVSPTSISISGTNSDIVLSGSNVNSSVFTVLDIQNNSYDGRVIIGFRGSRIMFYSKNWPTASSDVAIGEVYRDGNTLKVRTS